MPVWQPRDLSHRPRPTRTLPSNFKEKPMTLTAEKTVRELALEIPAATRVFERLQIDYCCGGNRTLEDACRAAGVPLDRVLASLDTAAAGPAPAVDRDWLTEPLAELVAHIRDTHHAYTRDA